MGGSQRMRPAHFFVADNCLKNMSSCLIMQTFAQSNCMFTPRSATNI